MKRLLKSSAVLSFGLLAGYAMAVEDPLSQYLPLTAAPDHHQVILENESVRVLDVRIPPGDTVPAHQHDLPSVFITLSPADLVFRDLSGERVRDAYRDRGAPPQPQLEWRDPAPAPRIVTNIDSVELRALRIELKKPAS